MASKIHEFVKSKETMTLKILEAKTIMSQKKNEMKQDRWQGIHDLEERKLALEEKRAMAELVAEENRTMTMDPTTMDAFTEELWDMRRLEIISKTRQARAEATAVVNLLLMDVTLLRLLQVVVSPKVLPTMTMWLERAFFIRAVA